MKTENPQAFPNDATPREYGMTLRDYFAAKAMQGINSYIETVRAMSQDMRNLTRDKKNDNIYDYIAQESYRFADAMLKERLKQKP